MGIFNFKLDFFTGVCLPTCSLRQLLFYFMFLLNEPIIANELKLNGASIEVASSVGKLVAHLYIHLC